MNRTQAEMILTGEYLLTMDSEGTILRDGGIAIAGDTILAVGPAADLVAAHPQAEVVAERRGLIMPGLINVHTHAAMALFRGLADDLPLMQWLTEHIFPREATLTGELVYQGTLLSLCEMIKSGTTSFCDMYLFAGEVARAAEESGVRAWVGEAIYDFPSPNYGALENGFAYTQNLIDRYHGHPLVSVTAVAHAVYTCAPALLTRVAKMAQEQQLLFNIHLSENEEEQQACLERYGMTPVAHLEALGVLDSNLIAAHCVMVSPDEMALLARRGVKAAHCPESNLKLASGIAPVQAMLDAGMTVGLGTDGSASNNDVDMFGEMGTAAKLQKVLCRDSTALSAASSLHAATLGGARVLRSEERIGSLEPGKKADCIVLDLNQPHLTPIYHPVSHLVYAARGSDVIHSVINGRMVMRDRQLLTLDEAAILARVADIAGALGRHGNGG